MLVYLLHIEYHHYLFAFCLETKCVSLVGIPWKSFDTRFFFFFFLNQRQLCCLHPELVLEKPKGHLRPQTQLTILRPQVISNILVLWVWGLHWSFRGTLVITRLLWGGVYADYESYYFIMMSQFLPVIYK